MYNQFGTAKIQFDTKKKCDFGRKKTSDKIQKSFETHRLKQKIARQNLPWFDAPGSLSLSPSSKSSRSKNSAASSISASKFFRNGKQSTKILLNFHERQNGLVFCNSATVLSSVESTHRIPFVIIMGFHSLVQITKWYTAHSAPKPIRNYGRKTYLLFFIQHSFLTFFSPSEVFNSKFGFNK